MHGLASISIFFKWFLLQKEFDFRPEVLLVYENNDDQFYNEDYGLQNLLKPKQLFEEYEEKLWEEIQLFKERLPPIEIEEKKINSPLLFEVELIGGRLFGMMFDGSID